MPVLSPSMDIKSLIERHAGINIVGHPKYVRGVPEYHSNCPWCPGSKDSFITRPDTGWYTHSTRAKGCGRHGDMLDFLGEWAGMSQREACEEIGLDPDELEFILEERAQQTTLARELPLPKEWQDSGRALIHALRRLRTLTRYPYALAHLQPRGISTESIERFDLQYIPVGEGGSWLTRNPEEWGLSPMECSDGVVKLPEGILIPWYADGHLWKLEVRRLRDVRKDVRYMEITRPEGSEGTILYNLDAFKPDMPAVLVESVFCAIIGMQVCGDIAVFLATGGAKKAQYGHLVERLKPAPCVLVAFDDDELDENGKRAGDEGAIFWTDNLPNAMRHTPWSKDINDMLREGKDIRAWLLKGLKSYDRLHKAKSIPVPVIPIEVTQPAPPAQPVAPTHRTLSDERVIAVMKRLQEGGFTFSLVNGRVQVEPEAELGERVRAFLQTYEPVILAQLQDEQDAREPLYQFGAVISRIVDELGGPGNVTITKHEPGQDEHMRRVGKLGHAVVLSDCTQDRAPTRCVQCRKKDFHHNLAGTGWVCLDCGKVHHFSLHAPAATPVMPVLSTSADFWRQVEEKNARPPRVYHGKPFTSEDWQKEREKLHNQRPPDRVYAHFPGGYAGYKALYLAQALETLSGDIENC